MKIGILSKIIFILILIGVLPITIFTFLTIDSYQGLIGKYAPYVAKEYPELISESQLNFENVKNQTYLIFLLIIVFVFFFSIVLSRRITYPIKKLIKATNELKKGNFDTRIVLKTKDEFEDLAESFNQMIQELQRARVLLEEEKTVLEIRVGARTRELRELAQSLDEKVKERTEELRIQRDRTMAIITNLVDGLIVLDKKRNIILINPNAEKFLGVQADKLQQRPIGRLIEEIDTIKELFRLIGYKEIKDNILREELVLKLPQRRVLEVSTISLITGEIVVILHDITREKLVEEMKTEFVSIAAHQLRTPLSAIKWSLKMILDGDLGRVKKEQGEFIEKAYESNERMIMLIGDLLNVTRIEEGRSLYNVQKRDIKELINNVVNLLKDIIKKKGLDLQLLFPKKKLPEVEVDSEKIELVLQNLLDNAITYTKYGGKVIISVEHKEPSGELLISIQDTGIGIPKEEQKRIFSKFFRGSNAMRLDTEGSGLGLFIVKNIIEAHNGKIWFNSQEGKGSIFSFTLPIFHKK